MIAVGKWKEQCGISWASGWIAPEYVGSASAEAVLQLHCIELNGDWDKFIPWAYQRYQDQLNDRQAVQIRTDEPIKLPRAA